MHHQAIAIEHKLFGEAHADLGGSYRDDAAALIALGRFTEAHAAIDRAIAIDKQTIGDAHPDHGDTLRILGELLCAERRCAEAVDLFRRAVALHEQEVGPRSPVLVEPLVGLCGALLAAGDSAAARAAGERAVAIGGKAPPDLRGAAVFCVARSEWLAGERDVARRHAREARTMLAALPFPAQDRPAVERWLADHP